MRRKMLTSLLLVAGVMCFAPVAVRADATKRRGLTEFCELYMQRYTKWQDDNGKDFDTHVYGDTLPVKSEDILSIAVTAGRIDVRTEDMSISEGIFTLLDTNAGDDKNEAYAMSFISALSALEYDSLMDSLFYSYSLAGGEAENSMEEAIRIFNTDISDALTSEAFNRCMDGESIKIYSGNYDYSLEYHPFNTGKAQRNQFWVFAKEHE